MRLDEARGRLVALGLEPFAEPDAWRFLTESAYVRSLAPRAVLWRAGSDAACLHVHLDGRVRVVRARRGRQHLVHVAVPGDTMGEVPTFAGGPYPATAVAAERTRCLVVPAEDARALVDRCGRAGRLLLGRLATRVRTLVARLEAQTLGSVRSRLASSLVGLAAEAGGDTLDVPSPQSEWAEDLGTVREVLARELATLAASGLVERTGRGRLRLLDEAALEAIALGGEAA